MVEIERKFLVSALPDLEGCPYLDLEQGYLPGTDDRLHVRIRRTGDSAVLTIKHGEGLARTEVEFVLTPEQDTALWPLTLGRRLRKRRHFISRSGWEFEVDVYADALEGLVTVEVEFDSVEEAAGFQPPEWLGPEVTADARFTNFALAASQRIPGVPARRPER